MGLKISTNGVKLLIRDNFMRRYSLLILWKTLAKSNKVFS